MSADVAIKSGAAERMSCLVKGLCGIGPVGLGAFANRTAVWIGVVCRERYDEAGMNLLQILCSLAQLLFSFLSGIAYNLSLRTVNGRSGVAHCVWLTAKGREHSARPESSRSPSWQRIRQAATAVWNDGICGSVDGIGQKNDFCCEHTSSVDLCGNHGAPRCLVRPQPQTAAMRSRALSTSTSTSIDPLARRAG